MQNIEWYHSLKQPAIHVPDWIFAPVWTVLYFLIALSLIFLFKNGKIKGKEKALTYFGIQLLLNLLWTPTFFGFQNITFALIICALLVIFIFKTITSFYTHSKTAAFLLVPYLLWTTFALYLNFEIWRLN